MRVPLTDAFKYPTHRAILYNGTNWRIKKENADVNNLRHHQDETHIHIASSYRKDVQENREENMKRIYQ